MDWGKTCIIIKNMHSDQQTWWLPIQLICLQCNEKIFGGGDVSRDVLSLALCRKFYNSHGKYNSELNEYYHMYQFQWNFAMFCVTSALGISWQRLNHPNLLVRSVYRFHVYFHIRLILHELGISLPHEDGFSKVKNSYIQSTYYSLCVDYGVDPSQTWMYGDWLYTTDYAIFGHEVKATERSPPDNLTRWIIK